MNESVIRQRPVPESRKPAREIIKCLNSEIERTKHSKKTEQEFEIIAATAFGTFTARRIQSDGDHLLHIVVAHPGESAVIIAPADQCSFMVRVFIPSVEHPGERVVVGFGANRESEVGTGPGDQQ